MTFVSIIVIYNNRESQDTFKNFLVDKIRL
uniref:Uncharacterized protein n=1 Tax=Siphoviridae sp. ctLqe90 TaxID=2825456 RepID=A0A8S5Q1M1_9CAUD|nr:MAG TPA: hypothetical protein [Siphoviridae sp. ctLqe90]